MKKINKPSKDLTKKDIMNIARACIDISLKVKKVLEKIKVSSISQNEIESKLKKSDISCYIDRYEDLEEIVADYPDLVDNVHINFFPKWFDIYISPKNYDGNWKIYNFYMRGCKDFSGVRLEFDKQKNSLRTWFFGEKWLKKSKLKNNNGKYAKVLYQCFLKLGAIKGVFSQTHAIKVVAVSKQSQL